MSIPIREKKHRLTLECYRGFVSVHYTLCIKGKQQVFTTESVFSPIQQLLLSELSRHHMESEVYMFMPDHAHIVLNGNSDEADTHRCISAFKQSSGFWFSKNLQEVYWQKDFYDRVIRKEEVTNTIIRYILNNPVRKGLVEDWKTYPYKGSTIHNFDEW